MKHPGWRAALTVAMLGFAIVAGLVAFNWSTVRDHAEAWWFQATKETRRSSLSKSAPLVRRGVEGRGRIEPNGVTILLSRPSRPEYNGSIESEIRWLKPLVRHAPERMGGGDSESLSRARKVVKELRTDSREANDHVR